MDTRQYITGPYSASVPAYDIIDSPLTGFDFSLAVVSHLSLASGGQNVASARITSWLGQDTKAVEKRISFDSSYWTGMDNAFMMPSPRRLARIAAETFVRSIAWAAGKIVMGR